MFPSDELTQIRADLETTLPDAGTIYALTRTSDGMGGWSEAWATAGTCPCRVDFRGGKESVNSAALTPYSQVILTVPQSTTITEQNRFEHSSGTYTVQSVNLGSWLGVKRASLEKI